MRALLLFVAAFGAAAATSQYSHRVWRIEDGLPQNWIRAIAQTPDGYLWVGTAEGLARFDGARFTVFDRSNTAALQDNGILSLRTARDGSLWIGTEGGGLVGYKGGTFRSFGSAEGLTNGFVRHILEDRSGVLWVGTDRGFFRREGAGFVRLDGTAEFPLVTAVSIAEDASGKIWVTGSPVGVLTVIGGKLTRAHEGCPAQSFRGVVASRAGFLWGVGATGVSRLDGGCPAPDRELPQIPIRSLVEASTGEIWMGTIGHGLKRLKGGQLTTFDDSSALPGNTVNAIFEDREQNLWVGTEDGLLRLSRSSVATIGAAEGLDDENVVTAYTGRDAVWLATLTGQVYRAAGGSVKRFQLPAPAAQARVRSALEDSAGTVWLGTAGDGLIRLAGGKATVYTKGDGPRSNTVRQLLEDRSGTIWIALDSGLSRWNGSGFRNYYLEDGLSYPSTRCMIVDAKGDILIGTDSGLNRVHDGEIVADAAFAPLAKEKIWAIHQDARGRLWLGTRGGGLLRLDGGKLTRFTTASGLPSNTIYQILVDQTGKFWMSGSSGIFSVDPAEFDQAAELIDVTAYGTVDGMRTSQMNGGFQPAGGKDAAGALWFAGVKGAVRVDPAATPRRRTPPMLIEKLVVDGVSIGLGDGIEIAPGHRHLELDFTLCDLVAPQRASFLYKLEGFDETWKSTSQRSVSYTNLKPGPYRFHVRAKVSSSQGDFSEASLPFSLRPHFYQTDWFSGLAALVCGTLILAGLKLYARQTKARYALLLNERMAERSRLAREMHDTVIQGCVGVSTLLEAVDRFRPGNPVEAGRLLNDARVQVAATLEEARQAIWDLRYATVENASITILFDLARKLGAEHHIEIETELAGRGELNAETDRTLLLVGREALRNAVAHARPSKIRISVTFRPSEAVLEVSDDGVGFDVSNEMQARGRHFGMIGMRERIEKAGGSIAIESSPGNGARITARAPLPKTGDEPSSGVPDPLFRTR